MRRENDERSFRDPVCGMVVSRLTAAGEYGHQGKRYYFCSPDCLEAFKMEPWRYLRRHRQRGAKPK